MVRLDLIWKWERALQMKGNRGSIDSHLLIARLKELGKSRLTMSSCFSHLRWLFSIEFEFLQHWWRQMKTFYFNSEDIWKFYLASLVLSSFSFPFRLIFFFPQGCRLQISAKCRLWTFQKSAFCRQSSICTSGSSAETNGNENCSCVCVWEFLFSFFPGIQAWESKAKRQFEIWTRSNRKLEKSSPLEWYVFPYSLSAADMHTVDCAAKEK